jgi:Ca-activated chloride channel family protein
MMNPTDAIDAIAALHFLRPQWLWALLALPLLVAWWRNRQRRASVWRGAVDAHLLPHLLDATPTGRARWSLPLGAMGYVLAVLALSGPSWRQIDQPLWQSRTPLLIALDLSSATLAPDLPPSRLAQARAKLATLLRERNGGQVGLVAYADDAFTVAPLTDDADNVALFLDALSPDVMPVDGQRSDRAIAWAAKLLRQAGFERGDILLMTDHADGAARSAAATAASSGYRVSVLGLGSEAGANYRRSDGSIIATRRDGASLRALAAKGNGAYAPLTADDSDLASLGVLDPAASEATSGKGETGRAWQDEGYWLLPPLMLLALLAFRRRAGVVVLLLCIGLPWQAAQAADPWRRPDQAAHARMQEGAQAYRKGEFERAAQLYDGIDTADAHYNRGNALAKAGQYEKAIEAYDRSLHRKRMDDALANKRAVEAAMKRNPPKGKKPGPKNPQQGDAQKPGKDGQPSPEKGKGGSPSPQQSTPPQPSQQTTPPQADDAKSQGGKPQEAKPSDAQAQRDADTAQRERMQRALQQAKAKSEPKGKAKPQAAETPVQRERRLANEAWLKRVPDDPGGLLRAKFRIEYERRQMSGQRQ